MEELISKAFEVGFSVVLLLSAVLYLNRQNTRKEDELKESHKQQLDEQKEMTKQVMELHKETLTTVSNNTIAFNRMSEVMTEFSTTKRNSR